MSKLKEFVFFREDIFYVVEIPPESVAKNAEMNPGTIKVETIDGKKVWPNDN